MPAKPIRQEVANPTYLLCSDGTQLSSNLGYTTLGATGLSLLAAADDKAARTTIGVGAITNRNRLINGGMVIDQRNAGDAQTITAEAALAYTVDRWYAYCTGANVTGQQVQGATAGQFRYQFTGAASVTAIGFGQRIEQLNCADLAGTTATLSVDLANSLLTTVTWTAYYANTADTFGTLASPTKAQFATGTFTVSSTVTRYSTQITIPIEAVTGIEIVFSVGAQTSGTWTIGDVQLEPGSIATPFEKLEYSNGHRRCLRYCQKIVFSPQSTAYHVVAIVGSTSIAHPLHLTIPLMRTSPTLNLSDLTVRRSNGSGSTPTTLTAAGSTSNNCIRLGASDFALNTTHAVDFSGTVTLFAEL